MPPTTALARGAGTRYWRRLPRNQAFLAASALTAARHHKGHERAARQRHRRWHAVLAVQRQRGQRGSRSKESDSAGADRALAESADVTWLRP